jgi:hypothetical protein
VKPRGKRRRAPYERLFDYVRRRDRKVYRALLVLLSADARFLDALGVVLEFMVGEARTRRTR